MTYHFICLITRLYEKTHVTIVTRVDNIVKVMKTHTFDRIDESRPTLSLGKRASLGDDTSIIEGAYTPVNAFISTQGIKISLALSLQSTFFVGTVPTIEIEGLVFITTFIFEYAITP